MWTVAINREEPIIAQGSLDDLNRHQTPRGQYKVNISLCKRQIYQRTYIEEIHSIFNQVIPVVSNIEFHFPEKPLTQKNIGEAPKGPQRKFWKEDLFLKYYKKKNFNLLSAPIPIKYLSGVTKVLHSLIFPIIK